MAYQGFLIAGYETGYQTTKEPWRSPEDAFVTLENARCEDGILTKRGGTSKLGQMIHGAAVQTTSVTGLHCHTALGRSYLIACDTARANILDLYSSAMVDVSGGSDIFSGGNVDLFWFLTYDDKTYMTNFQDGIFVFTGSTYDPTSPAAVAELDLSTSLTTNAKMNTVQQLYHLSDRILAYNIVDDGQSKPFRLRYSQTLARGNTPVFTAGNYLDVPTDDKPVTGRRLGRYIYLWHEQSLWMIRPTGDTDIPFAPDRVREDLGSASPKVCVPFEKGFLTVGHKDLIHFDGYETKKMNLPQLNNILDQFTFAALKYSWGTYDEPNQRIYITFAATGSTLPDRVLEYDITGKRMAVHKIPAHTMAMYNGSQIIAWDDADAAYSADGALLSDMPISGATDVLGGEEWYPCYGGRDGFVYRMFTGTNDAGIKFDFAALSARLNPFTKQGKRCALGRVAVLVDNDATASFTISLYKNTSSTAYKTQSVSCDGTGDKFWVSMHAGGEIGDWHQIKFSNDIINNTPVIHATWLEMEPAGGINP